MIKFRMPWFCVSMTSDSTINSGMQWHLNKLELLLHVYICCLLFEPEHDKNYLSKMRTQRRHWLESSLCAWQAYCYLSQLMRLWYLSHRRPAKAQASRRRAQPKIEISSTTGWLRMCVWRMNLRRTKSAIISFAVHGALSQDSDLGLRRAQRHDPALLPLLVFFSIMHLCLPSPPSSGGDGCTLGIRQPRITVLGNSTEGVETYV